MSERAIHVWPLGGRCVVATLLVWTLLAAACSSGPVTSGPESVAETTVTTESSAPPAPTGDVRVDEAPEEAERTAAEAGAAADAAESALASLARSSAHQSAAQSAAGAAESLADLASALRASGYSGFAEPLAAIENAAISVGEAAAWNLDVAVLEGLTAGAHARAWVAAEAADTKAPSCGSPDRSGARLARGLRAIGFRHGCGGSFPDRRSN